MSRGKQHVSDLSFLRIWQESKGDSHKVAETIGNGYTVQAADARIKNWSAKAKAQGQPFWKSEGGPIADRVGPGRGAKKMDMVSLLEMAASLEGEGDE